MLPLRRNRVARDGPPSAPDDPRHDLRHEPCPARARREPSRAEVTRRMEVMIVCVPRHGGTTGDRGPLRSGRPRCPRRCSTPIEGGGLRAGAARRLAAGRGRRTARLRPWWTPSTPIRTRCPRPRRRSTCCRCLLKRAGAGRRMPAHPRSRRVGPLTAPPSRVTPGRWCSRVGPGRRGSPGGAVHARQRALRHPRRRRRSRWPTACTTPAPTRPAATTGCATRSPVRSSRTRAWSTCRTGSTCASPCSTTIIRIRPGSTWRRCRCCSTTGRAGPAARAARSARCGSPTAPDAPRRCASAGSCTWRRSQLAGLHTVFTAENWSGRLLVASGIDGTVTNCRRAALRRHGGRHLDVVR